MDEGLANYMAGYWNVLDLMQVRDAALTDNVPKMSRVRDGSRCRAGCPTRSATPTFEFIESRWGKEGLRQFLFSLRKSVLGGGESAYEEALKLKPEEFDEQFDRYLKERFKPFRDKERPADYGRNLAPSPERTHVRRGALDRAVADAATCSRPSSATGRDQELDIVLHLGAATAQVIRNLTKGFDKDRGFEYIATAGGLRGNLVPWIAWAPVGDRLAYFARTEKYKTLIVQNIVTGEIERRFELKTVDGPESPAFSPDGQQRRVLRRCRAASATSSRSTSRPATLDEHHQGRRSPTTRRRSRPTARRSSTRRASAATTSCSSSTSRPARRSS